VTADPTTTARERALRRATTLQWLTIGWNAMEVFVTIGLGIAAGSLALVAFGLDSLIEIWAGLVVLWHLRGVKAVALDRSARALRLVGFAFLALAAFLAVSSSIRLVAGSRPEESPWGIAYLAVTVAVMLSLASAKAATSRSLADHPLASEARMTFLDAGLAASVLLALVLNAVAGWWWADSVAALLIAVLAVLEGRENLEAARG
jgi:divalent metal cation (Fe/Co/Zn/Cd) transporter